MKVQSKLIKAFGALLVAVMVFAALPIKSVSADWSTFDNPGYYYAAITDAPDGTYYRSAGFSPDGSKIVAQKSWGTQIEVVLMDADGSNETIISAGDSGTGDIYGYMNPFWSDDGTTVGFVEVHQTTSNKAIAYNVAGGTQSYIYEPTTSDVCNPDFLGNSKTAIVFWDCSTGDGYDLWTWDGSTLTNITNTPDYNEYEPVSNGDGTKIIYWSGERDAEPINTTHTLTFSGGVWTKDVGFTAIPDTYWSYWTTPDANQIAVTRMASKDIEIYDATGAFVTDLSGPGYSGGSGQWNFFGSMPQAPNGEFVITSNAERTLAGRDIIIANPRSTLYVAPSGSDDNPGTESAPFATIQKAVAEAASGGTVHVAAGTYVEVGQIVIDKDLTLIGEDKDTTIIKPAQNTGSSDDPRGWFLIGTETSPDVEFNLSGFTLDGTGYQIHTAIRSWGTGVIEDNNIINIKYSKYVGLGVYLYGATTVQNNYFENIERVGMYAHGKLGPTNAQFLNNTYVGKGVGDWLDYGVEVEAGGSAIINGNTITDCVGVASSDGSTSAAILATTYFADGTTATITSNNLWNNTVGIALGYNTSDTTFATITGNDFENNEYQVIGQSDVNFNVTDTLTNNTFDKVVVIEGEPVIYTSIQEAIDDASDGDTIKVGPGTYDEQLIIGVPNLTIQSTNGAASTIIDVPDGTLTTGVKVLANMGSVTFDGFTVKDFTENGIVQGMADHEGTAFHVLNNVVMPKADYLRNGIQVSGDGSTVIGNTIQGAPLTEDWAGSGIMVVNASNVTVEGNTVAGGDIGITVQNYSGVVDTITVRNNTVEEAHIGLALYGRTGYRDITNVTIEGNAFKNEEYTSGAYGVNIQTADVSGLIVNENLIKNVSYAFRVSGTSAAVVGPVTLWHNQFVYNYYQLLYYNDPATVTIDAEENWWDNISGPAESGFGSIYTGTTGLVDHIPWCGDPECSFLVYPLEGEITETVVIDSPIVYLLKDGTTIDAEGPCFEINADNVTIMTESPGGAVCYPGSPGIEVYDGATNIVIEGLEIDGQGTAVGNGIDFLGAVEDVIISDTFIHDMDGDGVHFASAPAGYVEIKGNLFKDNTGVGVETPVDLDVTYNAWGAYGGPTAGDGVSTNILSTSYTPWTHVDIDVVYQADSSRYAGEVAYGEATPETITYDVFANLQNAFGGEFTLTFDPAKLQVLSVDTTSTVFPSVWGDVVAPGVTYDNVTGKITFAGGAMSAVSGTDQFLFSVTFTGAAVTDSLNPLTFNEEDADLFGMNPGYGSSVNIYADALVGEADVNVYALPTLSIDPLATYAVGNAKEFTLTITNPADGRAYTDLNVDLDLPGDAVLEYWDGSAWVVYAGGVPVGELAVDDTVDVLFRITFGTAGDIDIPVTLNDGTIFLVEDTFTFTVLEAYTLTGTVQMQGRTERSGVLVELFHEVLTEYGYDTLSTNLITDNFTLNNLAEGLYTISITHDRYLDFTTTGFELLADVLDLARLELKGGDVAKDNVIDILDAAMVGTNYGSTGGDPADANFDGKVNIQDLAMIGGNYGLDSDTAYTTWEP